MKAPDKIYVPESDDCSNCIDMKVFAEYRIRRGIEYIRKDALLEWANMMKNGANSFEMMEHFKLLIDKLNSL